MSKESFVFQAEVSKLLDIVARSLYSHKEVFLRELVSNASDACDRLRYEGLTTPALMEGDAALRIAIGVDDKKGTLTVTDNGIGMNRDDLVGMLGTIARSGTQAFVERLSGDAAKDVAMIGQFGVGFYSSFMVADSVEVVTRKAGEAQAWRWVSDGHGSFTVEETQRAGRGTTVTLHLNADSREFLDKGRLEGVIKRYSDHIAIPIMFDGDKDAKPLNQASALWTRSRAEIAEDQYHEFYRHVSHDLDSPWMTLHNRVEGVLSYTSLLFIPKSRPFDLFDPERKPRLKLYVRRVFITDDCGELLPGYLRFVRGIVDSEDLSLNVSREMLQRDPKLAKIRSGLVKRILGDLAKKAENAPDDYRVFWDAFGAVLKEGLYEDFENRESLLGLARFRTTAGDEPVGLAMYVERMKPGQEAIYYITGEDAAAVANSPQLEGFKARGVEVLLLTDPVDEFWVPAVAAFKGKDFRSVTRADTDLGAIAKDGDKASDKPEEPAPAGIDALIAAFKLALGKAVSDVRLSKRLTESPVCLVAKEGGMDMRLERLLKRHQQLGDDLVSAPVLEVNPDHALIRRLAGMAEGKGGGDAVAEAAHLLLDQARILEGEAVPDPVAFGRRLTAWLEKGLI